MEQETVDLDCIFRTGGGMNANSADMFLRKMERCIQGCQNDGYYTIKNVHDLRFQGCQNDLEKAQDS